jgi:hypothetical protein
VLDSINLADKTYEELLAEAIEKIPTYTDEWTNFNVSDPGITILQNLTSLQVLQREAMNDIPESVRYALLRMLGFVPADYRAAEIFLSAPEAVDGLYLPTGEKLMAEDLCYEADGAVTLEPWGVRSLYCETEEGLRDITYLQGGVSRTGAPIFGIPARVGAAFYVFFDDIPDYRDSLRLLTRIMDEEKRNPFGGAEIKLAELKWQFYTKSGWVDVAFEDGTRGFLESGVIRIFLTAADKAVFSLSGAESGAEGYVLRCILESEQYDNAPRLHSVTSNVFSVKQKDSRIQIESFDGNRIPLLNNPVALSGYYVVFCDEDGSGNFYRYLAKEEWQQEGRYYTEEKVADGIRLHFHKHRFGYAPSRRADAIRIFCCDVKSAEHLVLGRLMGYDDQIIPVNGFGHILPEDFCIMAELADDEGTPVFQFIYPDDEDPRNFCYQVQSEPAQIHITSPGDMEGALLHIASCAETDGARGNIRPWNVFVPEFLSSEAEKKGEPIPRIVNALAADGGSDFESVENLRLRFLSDMRDNSVAVTLADYEHIAKITPGLCIHKVKAVSFPEQNLVRVAVKPYSADEMPTLSPLYEENILANLNKSRMIGTRIEIAPPIYKPIDVRTVVYAKGYYENVRGSIEAYLRQELDGVTGDMEFGSTISYNRLYKGLEALDCVASLYDFSVAPQDWTDARPEGPDIILGDDVLSYTGELLIEIR